MVQQYLHIGYSGGSSFTADYTETRGKLIMETTVINHETELISILSIG